jgi:hypothetical protein
MNDHPCIVFLIPFASRKVKSKWTTASAHLRQTLRSIANSSNGNYRVVVGGHEAPDFDVNIDSRFHFLSLNHPIPIDDNYAAAQVRDKLSKLAAAWKHAKSAWNPRYVMKVDADDFISSRLVDWLEKAEEEAGFLVKYGWVWRSGARYLIQHTEYFDRTCGSSLIIRSDVADKSGPFLTEWEGVSLGEASSRYGARDQYSLVPGSATSTLLLNDSFTRFAAAQFRYLGLNFSSVPFNAVVYRTGNPESIEGGLRLKVPPTQTLRMIVGRIRRVRFITKSLRREFMLG